MPTIARVGLGLVILTLSGCLPFKDARTPRTLIKSYNPFGFKTVVSHNKVVIRSVLIERPAGDLYLCQQLWETTLKPLPPETAALLAENGIRVGTFPSNAPAELLELIQDGNGTVRPNETTVNLTESKVLPVNGPVVQAEFETVDDIGASANPNRFQQVQFGFEITADDKQKGKLELKFEPKLQHGQRQGWLRPTLDGTGFTWLDGKEAVKFPKLKFTIDVRPGEYLVIGPTEQPAKLAGGAWFVSDSHNSNRMRVLVVRAWRGPDAPAEPLPGRRINEAKD